MKRQIAHTGLKPAAGSFIQDYANPLGRLISLQNDHTCLLMIADYHTLKSGSYVGRNIEDSVTEMVLDALALGFNLVRGICFLQSQVPQLAELASILSNLVHAKRLLGKDSLDDTTYGHLGYSLFQAAYILMFGPTLLPVGVDQEDRILLAQGLAGQFNERFGDVFHKPTSIYTGIGDCNCVLGEEFESRRQQLEKVPGLVGDVLNLGCSEARVQGQHTLERVKKAIGFGYTELLA